MAERVLEFRRRSTAGPGDDGNSLVELLREMLEQAEAGKIRSCAIAYLTFEEELFTTTVGADQGVCALLGAVEILKADILTGQVEQLPRAESTDEP